VEVAATYFNYLPCLSTPTSSTLASTLFRLLAMPLALRLKENVETLE
jgi:hypothetical protein